MDGEEEKYIKGNQKTKNKEPIHITRRRGENSIKM
jgi:hypothetical protein